MDTNIQAEVGRKAYQFTHQEENESTIESLFIRKVLDESNSKSEREKQKL